MKARLAPTPSGYLHAGNAANFLLNAELARRAGASLLLRFDDLDRARYRPAYVTDALRVIGQLGVAYDEGPRSVEELEATWSQHHRLPAYRAALDDLRGQPRLFACRCSRRELAAGEHPHGCRRGRVALDEADVAWRIDTRGLAAVTVPDRVAASPFRVDLDATMRDFAVRRRDGTPSYQLACTVDDLTFGITTVGRGQDLLPSTAAQLLLADLLGYAPATDRMTFVHHPLVTDPDGAKLSKSAGAAAAPVDFTDATLGELRKLVAGWLPQ